MSSQTRTKSRKRRLPLTYVVAVIPVAAALNIVGGYINTVATRTLTRKKLQVFFIQPQILA